MSALELGLAVAILLVLSGAYLEIRRLERSLAALLAPPAPAAESGACVHPDDYRTDRSTMGFQRWICDPAHGGCGYTFERDIRASSRG